MSSIRPATAADLPAMMSLEKNAATAAHWSIASLRGSSQASEPNRVALVLSEENDVQVFAIARVVRDEWEIENIVVAGAARRRGLGTRFLSELLRYSSRRGAKAIFLEVRNRTTQLGRSTKSGHSWKAGADGVTTRSLMKTRFCIALISFSCTIFGANLF